MLYDEKNYIDTQELTDIIFAEFSIEENANIRRNINKEIIKLCKSMPAVKNGKHTDLWDKSRVLPKGQKKAKHLFNKNERNHIVHSVALKEYILKNIAEFSPQVKEKIVEETDRRKELKKAADELNKRNLMYELIDNNEPEFEDVYIYDDEYEELGFVSREEAHREKLFLMVEALFLERFTPIDEDLLWKDMNRMPLLASTNTDFTPEIMESIQRYERKDYYKPLDKKDV
ncbi:MAG: hypothetical protein ACI4XC_02600 [Eubacterium sp.]